jgi:hypothetical protein
MLWWQLQSSTSNSNMTMLAWQAPLIPQSTVPEKLASLWNGNQRDFSRHPLIKKQSCITPLASPIPFKVVVRSWSDVSCSSPPSLLHRNCRKKGWAYSVSMELTLGMCSKLLDDVAMHCCMIVMRGKRKGESIWWCCWLLGCGTPEHPQAHPVHRDVLRHLGVAHVSTPKYTWVHPGALVHTPLHTRVTWQRTHANPSLRKWQTWTMCLSQKKNPGDTK